MKRAEILLDYMDRIKEFIELIGSWIMHATDYIAIAQEWIHKILELIEKGIAYLVNALDGRPENKHLTDDHMFV